MAVAGWIAAFLFTASLGSSTMASAHRETWKVDAAESFWSDGAIPKGFDVEIGLDWSDNRLVCTAVDRTNPSKPYHVNFAATLDDAVNPLPGNQNINEIRIKRLAGDEFQVLEQKDGDVVVGQHWKFSQDRHRFIRWGVGKGVDGRSRAFYEVYERK